MAAITIEHISKKFGGNIALNDVDFDVQNGELFGLIGPDGAGKSTLFRILTTLLLPDGGSATVCGHDVVEEYKEVRKKVGYMPGRFSLYQDLSIEENLNFFATIFGTTIAENYDLIKDIYVQIEPFKKRLAGQLSGGMKQKLALCCALIHKPEVLFLDEPTTGVDSVSRKEFWEMLKKIKENNIAILVSTPYMDEAGLCDKIALIQNGNILKIDRPSSMVKSFSKPIFAIRAKDNYKALTLLRNQEFTESALPFGESIHLITKADMEVTAIKEAMGQTVKGDISVQRIEPTIEDIFLDLGTEENKFN